MERLGIKGGVERMWNLGWNLV